MANESYVDLSYRGLSLGRRIKLSQMRPSTGYLEHPTPMPVGTAVSITADDGIAIEAVVTTVHEQVGGSEKAPGMTVKPALADAKLAAWWKERVTLPELEAPKRPERTRPVTVRPRTHTVPNPVGDGGSGGVAVAVVAAVDTLPLPVVLDKPAAVARIDLVKAPAPAPAIPEPIVVDEKKTTIMNAVDQELLEQLSRGNEVEQLARTTTGDHPIVDDGQRTIVMDAVDPAALGLDVSASGSMPSMDRDAADDDGDDDTSQPTNGNGNGDKKPSTTKKRRKKRR